LKARFEPTDVPFKWVSREQAEEYAEAMRSRDLPALEE
jgi:hypothetical protein